MRIENLKRWQWCIIGVMVGAAFAFIRLSMLPEEKPGLERIAPNVFEANILRDRNDPTTRRHVYKVENIQLHPPTEMVLPGDRSANGDYLSYEVLLVKTENPKKADRFPRQMVWAMANPNDKSIVGSLKGLTMQQYVDKLNAAIGKLDKTKRQYAKVEPFSYKVAWIEKPKAAYPIYAAGGLIVIGMIWPTLLGFLIEAGYGRAPSADDEFNLSRYKSGKTSTEMGKAAPTVAEIDQLAQLEAELEAKLKNGEVGVTDPTPKPATAPAPMKVLNAGPLEAPKEAPQAAQQPKGFGADHGDYYPTEVHGKKP